MAPTSKQAALFLLAVPLTAAASNEARQASSSSLLGPINFQIPSIQIDSITVSLITFADEVIDISGISIFGNVNDGSMNCTANTDNGDEVVVGPVTLPEPGGLRINLSLITFSDEVIDFSNVAIFGDVNDAGCE